MFLAQNIPSVDVMGLRLHEITMPELVDACMAKEKVGVVVTPNAHFFVKAGRDPSTRQLYNSADISVCDSRIIQRLLWLANMRVPLIAGSDLTAEIFSHPQARNLRIAVIGGKPGYAAKILQRFDLACFNQIDFPWQPIFSDKDIDEICSRISGQYDLVFVCLGSPLQERVATQLRKIDDGRFPTVLCVGASLDFLVGAQKRAPVFVQQLGLEWAFRFTHNPTRLFKRYFIECPAIFVIFIRWLIHEKFR